MIQGKQVEKDQTKKEHSYGIIPLRHVRGKWEVFLVQHLNGHWALPKGHPEPQETALETAKRELFEETGLEVKRLIPIEPFRESYEFDRNLEHIQKTVTYFLAEVSGTEVLQQQEMQNGLWIELGRAHEVATYQQMKNLLLKIAQLHLI
jgi:bis(5'-nucleosidyl)-tetraphosphatase